MKIIDISVTVDGSLPTWPGDPGIHVSRFLDQSRGDLVNASAISCSMHTGTHVDAPFHHFSAGAGTESLALNAMVGPATVVDLAEAAEIGAAQLDALRLPAGVERLLCRTRNSGLWGDADRRFRKDYVAVSPDGAAWLVDHGVRLIGVDYLSVEKFDANPPDTHRRLLGADVVILEGLDLRNVTPGPYWLVCLPWKVCGVDGAPARAILIEGALS